MGHTEPVKDALLRRRSQWARFEQWESRVPHSRSFYEDLAWLSEAFELAERLGSPTDAAARLREKCARLESARRVLRRGELLA